MPARCLDEVKVVSLIEGRLTTEELAATEAHIDACETCRALLAELARDGGSSEPLVLVRPGEAVGRYVILSNVGAGGMGMVFAAWDPELDRKIALKLVSESQAGDAKAQHRLMEEARALASVRHPNVIAIYDVGRAAGRVFIAMEYMEAGTLGAWLAAEPRPWRAVIDRFIPAGRGLAAAHDAQLVHRDFKPDNVLLSQAGRCVVTDFGLAAAPPPELASEAGPLPTTAAWGTPGYMAPEALRHAAVTARADQFSFCVALWEAVYGEPPFAGKTVPERLSSVRDGVRRDLTASARSVPATLKRHLNRGLSLDPSARFSSMDALLRALETLRSPPRRRGIIAVAAVAAAGVAGAVAIGGQPECDGGRDAWKPMWSDVARAEQAAAFQASGAVAADETWRRFSGGVDGYIERWAGVHQTACEATEGSAEQRHQATETLQCLSGRREQTFALLEALAQPSPDALGHSLSAVASLPSPADCAEPSNVDGPATAPTEATEAMQRELASIDTIWRLSQPDIVRPRLTALEAQARAAGADAVLAGVRVNQGKLLVDEAEHQAAHTALLEGGMLALSSGAPRVAAEAWISLLALDGAEQQNFVWATHWEQLATATLGQLGHSTRWHAMLAAHQGLVRANEGNWPAAKDAWERAVAIGVETLGDRHPDVAAFRVRLGETLALLRQFDAAREQHELALAQQLQLYGEMHRETARTLRAIGHTLVQQNKPAEALPVQRRCLEIQRAVLPPGHREIGYTLGNLGITLMSVDAKRADEALVFMQEGLAIMAKSQEPDHNRALILRHQIARILKAQGRLTEARDRWLSILEELDQAPKNPAVIARVHLRLGITLRELDDMDGSATQLRLAVNAAERAHGADNGEVLVALVELGQTQVASHSTDLSALQRALAHPAIEDAPDYDVRARSLLAQAQAQARP